MENPPGVPRGLVFRDFRMDFKGIWGRIKTHQPGDTPGGPWVSPRGPPRTPQEAKILQTPKENQWFVPSRLFASDGLLRPQDEAKRAQEGPLGHAKGPKRSQQAPERPQEASKLPPRGSREASQETPRGIQEASPQPRHGGGMGRRQLDTRMLSGFKSR